MNKKFTVTLREVGKSGGMAENKPWGSISALAYLEGGSVL